MSQRSFSTFLKQSDSDPIPTWLLQKCASVLVPTITNIVNCLLALVSSIPLSSNLPYLLCLKNLIFIRTSSQIIVLFLIFLSYLKYRRQHTTFLLFLSIGFYRAAFNADAVQRWQFCSSVCPSVCQSVRPSVTRV